MIETMEKPAATLSDATREKVMGVSIATLCTALFRRGLRNQSIQDVRPVAPKGRNMVGPAYTLRYIPAREDLNGSRSSAIATTRSASPSRSARPAPSSSWTAARTRAPRAPAASSSPA